MKQTVAQKFSSSILAFTGKSDFQFSKLYNINRALEPNIPGFGYAAMIKINQNKFYVILHSFCILSCCTRGVLMLSHVVLVLCRVESCCYQCSFLDYNQFHNILRLFDVLPNFPFTTMGDYYL